MYSMSDRYHFGVQVLSVYRAGLGGAISNKGKVTEKKQNSRPLPKYKYMPLLLQ